MTRTTARRDVRTLVTGAEGRSSRWALLGQVASAFASVANLLLLARALGPGQYGLIVGALALVLAIGPFSALGADKLVVRDVAVDPGSAPAALTRGCLTVAFGAGGTVLLLSLFHVIVLPQVPLTVLLAVAVAELLANSIVLCTVGAFFAAGRSRSGGTAMALTSVAKMAAVLVFTMTGSRDIAVWAVLYAGFSIAVASGVVLVAFANWGRPVLTGYHPITRAREGLPFSLNLSATVAQNDVDKVLLVRFGFTEEAGVYAVAYRLLTVSLIPVLAVMQASYPRYFQYGKSGGIRATAQFGRRLARPIRVYALVACLLLVAGSPLLPVVLGKEYAASTPLLVALAPLVVVKAMAYMPADALTGAGRQLTRTVCILTTAALNLLLCLLLIPRHGLHAAIGASFAAELLYVLFITSAVRRASARADALPLGTTGP